MITPRMYQVKYDASLKTVLSNFRFILWGPAPHHSLKNRIFFWLPARWASGISGDHQQDHQCLWLLLCYSLFILSFIACVLLGIKLLLLVVYYCNHWCRVVTSGVPLLTPGRCRSKIKTVRIKFINTYCEMECYKIPLTIKSTLVRVVTWCYHTQSHYLSQFWLKFLLPYGFTRQSLQKQQH